MCAIPMATVSLLAALPDTQLWRRLEKEGRLLAEARGNNTDITLNFVTKMDSSRLIKGYTTIMRTIYSPREYYERILHCLARLRRNRPDARRLSFAGEIATLARVLITLGVRERERREFWSFIKRVLVSHRQEFPNAIMLAAVGYHFRKLTQTYCEQEGIPSMKTEPSHNCLAPQSIAVTHYKRFVSGDKGNGVL